MPTPTWPSAAKMKFDGFAVKREPTVMRTQTEGLAKQTRVKSRALVTRAIVAYFASASDYQAFLTWFNTDLSAGASWFDWTDPADGVTKTARIVGGDLASETPRRKLFDRWEISMMIETWGT